MWRQGNIPKQGYQLQRLVLGVCEGKVLAEETFDSIEVLTTRPAGAALVAGERAGIQSQYSGRLFLGMPPDQPGESDSVA